MNKMMNEEARTILRRIVESQARREVVAINMLGHCLKYLTELDAKLRVAEDLDLSLRLFRELRAVYSDLGWKDLDSAVRERTNELPYPASRLEFGLAYHLCGLAREVAMESYVDCVAPGFAAVARSYVEAAASRPRPERFEEFCQDPSNRPAAQEHLNRWLAIAVAALGRPGTPGDERAVELGLRSRRVGTTIAVYLERVRPFAERCGLALPALADLGVDAAAVPKG